MEKFKFSKKNVFLSTLCFIIFFINGLVFVLSLLNPSVGTFLWYNFYNNVSKFYFSIFGDTDIYEIVRYLFYFIIAFNIVLFFRRVIKKKDGYVKKANTALTFIIVPILIMQIISVNVVTGNSAIPISYLFHPEYASKTYTGDDLKKAYDYVQGKLDELNQKLKRDENGDIIFRKDLVEASNDNLIKLKSKYPFLAGPRIDGYVPISDDPNLAENRIMGLTFYSTFVINVADGAPTSEEYMTIIHEFAHARGAIRESDATYISSIASIESDNVEEQYAGYKEIANFLLNALEEMNLIEDDYRSNRNADNCLNNNYNEYCDFVLDSYNYYIDNNEEFLIFSYKLDQYKDYDSFINKLEVLEKDFKAEFYIIDDKKVSLDDIKNKTITGNVTARIKKKNSSTKKILEFLQENHKIFSNFASKEEYDSYEETTDARKEDFYVKPFEVFDLFGDTTADEEEDQYDYDRSSRLFLEYFDNLGVLKN